MKFPDPFAIPEPGFEKYEGPQDNSEEFSQPDLTPRTVKQFLRSPDGQREIERIIPPAPQPAPERKGAALGYIQGY